MTSKEGMVVSAIRESSELVKWMSQILTYGVDIYEDEDHAKKVVIGFEKLKVIISEMQSIGILPYLTEDEGKEIASAYLEELQVDNHISKKLGRINPS